MKMKVVAAKKTNEGCWLHLEWRAWWDPENFNFVTVSTLYQVMIIFYSLLENILQNNFIHVKKSSNNSFFIVQIQLLVIKRETEERIYIFGRILIYSWQDEWKFS